MSRLIPARAVRLAAVTSVLGALLLPPAANAATSAPAHGADATVSRDITFIAMLVPHHQMAVDMASVARTKATGSDVRRLAAHIADEQSGQIRRMKTWLADHRAAPEPPPGPVQEMARQDLRMLRSASGTEVDRMFLMMMRPHHAQAVSESGDELDHGRNGFALSIARSAKSDQTREISVMNDLLAGIG